MVGLDGTSWFFPDEDSAKIAQIRATPEVDVSFSDAQGHSWTSWFPDGLDTSGLTVIEVEVEVDSARYGEGPTSTVAGVAGDVRAAITKNPSSDPIRNDTIEL